MFHSFSKDQLYRLTAVAQYKRWTLLCLPIFQTSIRNFRKHFMFTFKKFIPASSMQCMNCITRLGKEVASVGSDNGRKTHESFYNVISNGNQFIVKCCRNSAEVLQSNAPESWRVANERFASLVRKARLTKGWSRNKVDKIEEYESWN